MSDAEPLRPGEEEANGRRYMVGPKGELTPTARVKPQDLLEDGLVRELHEKGEALSKAMAEYKAAAFAAVDSLNALIWEKHQAKPRGAKGNQTLTTYDGTKRVLVQVSDRLSFGPELQVAKDLVMECVQRWAETSSSELVALVENAFRLDKGQINRGALFSLLRLNIEDPAWMRGMDAIRDSIRVDGSTRYFRLAKRKRADDEWVAISLDLATVKPAISSAAVC